MTIKHLTGRYPGGYTLSAAYTGLVIESTARVGGAGVSAAFFATIRNDGVVHAINYHAGVELSAGGMVTNGSATDATALIEGTAYGLLVQGSAGTVTNFGTIEGAVGRFGKGVILNAGGMVTNGSATDATALIEGGGFGVLVQGSSGTVTNFGTIKGAVDAFSAGVGLGDGGTVTNGSATDTTALIEVSGSGVLEDLAGTVTNFGTIETQGYYVAGVELSAGGMVTNGSATDATALIEGGDFGVLVEGSSGTVTNFGAIEALGTAGIRAGVALRAGGMVTNGSATDATALIEGAAYGLFVQGSLGTIANFGTIESTLNSFGFGVCVLMTAGGTVTNGSATDATALIEGGRGVQIDNGKGTVVNFGTILTGKARGLPLIGVSLSAGGRVTNGSAADATALIKSCYTGVVVHGSGTVTNFGTIVGTAGVAVDFFSAGDKLRVEPGAVFKGAVLGGGGVLALASGRGVIDALAGGRVTVSGRGRATTYSHFGTLKLAKGARFTLSGTGRIAGGGTATLIDNGRLTVTGALAVTGTLLGRGTILLAGGGTVKVGSAAPATLSTAFKSGAAATLALGAPAGFAATIAGFAAGETIDLIDAAATSAVLNASDQLVISNGATTVATLQLRGDYAGDSFDLASDGHGGTAITLTPGPAAAPAARLVSAMASLTAGAGAAVAPVSKPEEAFRPLLASPRMAPA